MCPSGAMFHGGIAESLRRGEGPAYGGERALWADANEDRGEFVHDVPKPSERVALLVGDMQNAFFEDPNLERHRESLVLPCNELAAFARSTGMPIFNIRTEHAADKSTWTLNMLDDGQGFLFEGSEQARNPRASISPVPRMSSSDATADSGAPELGDELLRLGVEEVASPGCPRIHALPQPRRMRMPPTSVPGWCPTL